MKPSLNHTTSEKTAQPLRVLALTRYTRRAPSSRLRFYNLQAPLVNHGIALDCMPFFSEDYLAKRYAGQRASIPDVVASYARRLAILPQLSSYDALWIQAEMLPLLPGWLETRLLRLFAKRWVLDIDDALFLPHEGASLPFLRRLLASKIPRLSCQADLCSITHEYCGAMLQAQGGRYDVVLGQGLDLERYAVVPRAPEAPVTIGWIGTPSTAHRYLPLVVDTLNRLQATTGCRVVLMGAGDAAPTLNAERLEWREDAEVAAVQSFDIGIMPLLDTPWEKGKSGLKLAQSMACGRVAVGTAVGFNHDLITHGVDGLLVPPGAEGWHDALLSLLQDSSLRERLGTAARRKIEANFDLRNVIERIATMLHRAAGTMPTV